MSANSNPHRSLPPPPPLLLALVLLLWGWQNAFLPYALPMAVLLEFSRYTRWYLAFDARDFRQLADVSSIAALIVIVWSFRSYSANGIFHLLSLSPFLLSPLLLAQCYSRPGQLKLSALFIGLRRVSEAERKEYDRAVDLRLPYFALCLLAASAGTEASQSFLLCCMVLMVVLLSILRPSRQAIRPWLCSCCLMLGLAGALQYGIKATQDVWTNFFVELLSQFMPHWHDPFSSSTAIGSLRRSKTSDHITIWLRSERELVRPLLLAVSRYSDYRHSTWRNPTVPLEMVDRALETDLWPLQDAPSADVDATIGVTMRLFREERLAALPGGAIHLSGRGVLAMQRTPWHTILLEANPGWLSYQVGYRRGFVYSNRPGAHELILPASEQALFRELAGELSLSGRAPEEIVAEVRAFFARDFRYQLERGQRFARAGHLQSFLRESRAGHCEYFATATALLLRAAGLPTRYVVGYSAHEYLPRRKVYAVRNSHAHAWVHYWLNGRWHSLDTTPVLWTDEELEHTSALAVLLDWVAWLRYRFSDEQDYAEKEARDSDYLLWCLLPLLVAMGWHLRGRRVRREPDQGGSGYGSGSGWESPLLALLPVIEKHYGPRQMPGESLVRWFERSLPATEHPAWLACVHLHYRCRFARGTGPELRQELVGRVQALRTALEESAAPESC